MKKNDQSSSYFTSPIQGQEGVKIAINQQTKESTIERIYITRICTAGIYSYKRIDEESVLLTQSAAMEYLKENFFEEHPNQKSLKLYYGEIDCFNVSTKEREFHKCFNLLGERIYDEDIEVMASERALETSFIPRFSKGDIVKIKSCKTSSIGLFLDTIGVVAGVPKPQEKSDPKQEIEAIYLVDFIGDRGFYDHGHPCEDELELYEDPLPVELKFIEALSQHYKGIKVIPESIFEALFRGEVYLLNHKIWREYEKEGY